MTSTAFSSDKEPFKPDFCLRHVYRTCHNKSGKHSKECPHTYRLDDLVNGSRDKRDIDLARKICDYLLANEPYKSDDKLDKMIHGLYAKVLRKTATDDSDFILAETHFLKAIEQEPTNSSHYRGYALLLEHSLKRYKEAQEYYLKAIKLRPDSTGYNADYASLLSNRFEKYEESLSYWNQANMHSSKRTVWSLLHYGITLFHVGNFKKCLKVFERLLKEDKSLEKDVGPYLNSVRSIGSLIGFVVKNQARSKSSKHNSSGSSKDSSKHHTHNDDNNNRLGKDIESCFEAWYNNNSNNNDGDSNDNDLTMESGSLGNKENSKEERENNSENDDCKQNENDKRGDNGGNSGSSSSSSSSSKATLDIHGLFQYMKLCNVSMDSLLSFIRNKKNEIRQNGDGSALLRFDAKRQEVANYCEQYIPLLLEMSDIDVGLFNQCENKDEECQEIDMSNENDNNNNNNNNNSNNSGNMTGSTTRGGSSSSVSEQIESWVERDEILMSIANTKDSNEFLSKYKDALSFIKQQRESVSSHWQSEISKISNKHEKLHQELKKANTKLVQQYDILNEAKKAKRKLMGELKSAKNTLQGTFNVVKNGANQIVEQSKMENEARLEKSEIEKQLSKINKEIQHYDTILSKYGNFDEVCENRMKNLLDRFESEWNESEKEWFHWDIEKVVTWFEYTLCKENNNNNSEIKIDFKKVKENMTNDKFKIKFLQMVDESDLIKYGINNQSDCHTLTEKIGKMCSKYPKPKHILNSHSKNNDRNRNDNKMKEKKKKYDCDEEYLCPISGDPMKEPVMAFDGMTYDKENIIKYWRQYGKSPNGTRVPNVEVAIKDLMLHKRMQLEMQEKGILQCKNDDEKEDFDIHMYMQATPQGNNSNNNDNMDEPPKKRQKFM